jgi:large subunit ribosomal protein L21
VRILAVMRDSNELVTAPNLGNATVTATIARHGRGDKVVVFKFKRKKQYKRTIGHRQNFTELVINEINA